VCRYNWHSAGSLGWPFPINKNISFEQNRPTQKQFYQTALGNCCCLKLAKCGCSLKKTKFSVLSVIIFGTLSFPVIKLKHRCIDATGVQDIQEITCNFVICGMFVSARGRLVVFLRN